MISFFGLFYQPELEFPVLQANHCKTLLLKQQLKPYSTATKLGYVLLLGFTSFPGRRYHIPLPLSSSALETFQLALCQESCPTPRPWFLIPARAHAFCQAFHRPPRLPPALPEVTEASSVPWPTSPRDANPQVSHLTSLKPHERGLHLQFCRPNHRNKSGSISLALPAFSPPRSPEWRLFSRWQRKESL